MSTTGTEKKCNRQHQQPDTSCPTGHIQYLTYFEGVFFDGFDDVFEEHFRCECIAVVNNRLAISPIPTVQFHTATALHQCSAWTENLCENTPALFTSQEGLKLLF